MLFKLQPVLSYWISCYMIFLFHFSLIHKWQCYVKNKTYL